MSRELKKKKGRELRLPLDLLLSNRTWVFVLTLNTLQKKQFCIKRILKRCLLCVACNSSRHPGCYATHACVPVSAFHSPGHRGVTPGPIQAAMPLSSSLWWPGAGWWDKHRARSPRRRAAWPLVRFAGGGGCPAAQLTAGVRSSRGASEDE